MNYWARLAKRFAAARPQSICGGSVASFRPQAQIRAGDDEGSTDEAQQGKRFLADGDSNEDSPDGFGSHQQARPGS